MIKKKITCREGLSLLVEIHQTTGYFLGLKLTPDQRKYLLRQTFQASRLIYDRKPKRAQPLINEIYQGLQVTVLPILADVLKSFVAVDRREEIMHPALSEGDLDSFEEATEEMYLQIKAQADGKGLDLNTCIKAVDELNRISVLSKHLTSHRVFLARASRYIKRYMPTVPTRTQICA